MLEKLGVSLTSTDWLVSTSPTYEEATNISYPLYKGPSMLQESVEVDFLWVSQASSEEI
ncbi:Hypothetical protein FKW44_019319 [Caligus rogercresseyi]|uniref:Uncharacterized protein n=1 Tax=Caligus rogercresseyi TaxID=217165 RepID=A0A7T8GVM6_CALRO|nr:Hypothetical protein FKW44_019319 [Caligus rogercresseyi]